MLDARYEKVREDGLIRSQAVQVAIGINREGRRCVLGVEMATERAPPVGGVSGEAEATGPARGGVRRDR